MTKRNNAYFEGKPKDYEELSNLAKENLVDIMSAADVLLKLCKEKQMPCVVAFSPKALMPMTAGTYNSDWDDDKQRRLGSLVGGLIKYLREQLWTHVQFVKFGPPD